MIHITSSKIFEFFLKEFMVNNTDILRKIPDEDVLIDLAELFKIFGDSTRIRILHALLEKSRSVTELSDALKMEQSAVSHQLKILRTSELVRSRREGKMMIYELADDHVSSIMNQGLEHVTEPKEEA